VIDRANHGRDRRCFACSICIRRCSSQTKPARNRRLRKPRDLQNAAAGTARGSENGMAMEEVITLFLGVLSLQYGTDVAETVPVSGLYRRIEVNS